VSAGAVTGRQRESIPAGTGTTDLPRETKIARKRQRERERRTTCPGDERREKERSDEKRAVSRGGAGVTIGEAGEGSRSSTGGGVR